MSHLLKELLANSGVGLQNQSFPTTEVAGNNTTGLLVEALELNLEARTDAQGIADVNAIIEGFQNGINTLNGIVHTLETTVSDGQTKRDNDQLNQRIAEYNETVPGEFQVVFPALQSNSPTAAKEANEAGLQSIKDRAASLAKATADFLAALITRIQKWVASFFGGAERLKKWAEATGKMADNFTPKDDKKKVTLSTSLLSTGKTVPGTSLVNDFGKFAVAAKAVDTEYELISALHKAAIDVAEKSKAEDVVAGAAAGGEFGKAEAAYASAKGIDKDSVMGGKYIKVAEGRRSVAASEDKPSKDSVELVILSPTDVVKVADQIGEIADIVIGSRKFYDDNKKVKDETVKAAQSLDKLLADSDTTAEQKSAMRAFARQVNSTGQRMIYGTHSAWATHCLSVAQAMAGFCDKSLK